MSEYRRYYQSGGHYFFTLVTHRRRPLFSDPENIKNFKIALNKVKEKFPFYLNAIVILPDHLHCLWKMPRNDNDFSMRWRLIKSYFSMKLNAPINYRKEKEVWQRRFWEHFIRSEEDWKKCMDYIHYNPVKHELVQSPYDWRHSSFVYWVGKGFYEKNWGAIHSIRFSGMEKAE